MSNSVSLMHPKAPSCFVNGHCRAIARLKETVLLPTAVQAIGFTNKEGEKVAQCRKKIKVHLLLSRKPVAMLVKILAEQSHPSVCSGFSFFASSLGFSSFLVTVVF